MSGHRIDMYYTYVLRGNNGRKYIGSTSDLKRRLKEHNGGVGGKYTQDNRPFKLIYYEGFLNKQDAFAREQWLKTGWGRNQINTMLKNYLQKGE